MLLRRNIEPACSYCLHGTDMGRGEIACRKRGIMSAYGHCGAFTYEPTKRVPECSGTLHITGLNIDGLNTPEQ